MRRPLAIVTALLACLLGLPATASAAPAPIGGGSVLHHPASGSSCTAAFAATAGTAEYLVVGPGCAASVSSQLHSGTGVLVGPVVATQGSYGYTLVQVTNTAAWELVGWLATGSGQLPITGSVETPVGGSVCLVHRFGGPSCGTVLAKNVTIAYPDGVVYGLTRTNVCVEPRTYAIGHVTGSQAQGVPFADSGYCSSGGTSYFVPINQVLRTHGLQLLTG